VVRRDLTGAGPQDDHHCIVRPGPDCPRAAVGPGEVRAPRRRPPERGRTSGRPRGARRREACGCRGCAVGARTRSVRCVPVRRSSSVMPGSAAFTTHLHDAGIDASIGTVGDALDNALVESQIGLYTTELMKPRRPWSGLADAELATVEWADWFNDQRLHTAIGDIPPREHETNYYAQLPPQPAAGADAWSLHRPWISSPSFVAGHARPASRSVRAPTPGAPCAPTTRRRATGPPRCPADASWP